MQPEINVLGVGVQTFGLFFALCFLAWGALVARRLRELGRPVDWAYEIVFVALAGGLIGARLYYAAQHWSEATADPLGTLVSGGGLVWYGGLAGGALAIVIWARRRGFLGLELLDLAGPGLALGYAVGRVGCQVSGDGDYGVASGLPWAMAYPDGVVPTTAVVHPSPIYETLVMGLVAWGLWRLRDRYRPGTLFALYLLLAGFERFLVEFVRRNEPVLAGLTAAQLEAAVLAIGGAAWLLRATRRGGGLRISPGSSGPAPATR